MKTIFLLSVAMFLPATSLIAKGQSELELLRARVDVQDRRISQLEKTLDRLTGSSVHSSKKGVAVMATFGATKSASSSTSREYAVARGDTLTRIAHRHHTSVAAIQKENNLKSDGLRIGQKLRIPAASTSTSAAEVKSKPSTSKSSKSVAVEAKSSQSSKTLTGKYTVKAGDTFYGIARQYRMNEASLQAANPKAVPTRLQIGQVLVVKPGTKSSSVPTHKSAQVTKKSPVKKKTLVQAPKPQVSSSRSSMTISAPAPRSSKLAAKQTGIRTITVHEQMTYGAFASKHGASTSQLNSLNGLNLSKSTMLAKGSELYVPQF